MDLVVRPKDARPQVTSDNPAVVEVTVNYANNTVTLHGLSSGSAKLELKEAGKLLDTPAGRGHRPDKSRYERLLYHEF